MTKLILTIKEFFVFKGIAAAAGEMFLYESGNNTIEVTASTSFCQQYGYC